MPIRPPRPDPNAGTPKRFGELEPSYDALQGAGPSQLRREHDAGGTPRPISSQANRSTRELVLELDPAQQVGIIPDICVTRHQGQCDFSPTPPTMIGGRACWTGTGSMGMPSTVECVPPYSFRSLAKAWCRISNVSPAAPTAGERAPFQTHPVVLVYYRSAADAEL